MSCGMFKRLSPCFASFFTLLGVARTASALWLYILALNFLLEVGCMSCLSIGVC